MHFYLLIDQKLFYFTSIKKIKYIFNNSLKGICKKLPINFLLKIKDYFNKNTTKRTKA